MRVITPSPQRPWPVKTGPTRTASIECLALAAATLVVAIGLFFTYQGQTRSFGSVQHDLASGALIDLRRLHGPDDLFSRLTMIGSPVERAAAARALYRRATSEEPLDHVGDLARVASPSVVSAVKPGAIVRMPDEYRRQMRFAAVLFFAS